MSDDACSSSGLFWSSDEASSLSGSRKYDKVNVAGSPININSDDTDNLEVTSHRRQRRDVDYKKLHDVSYMKLESAQISKIVYLSQCFSYWIEFCVACYFLAYFLFMCVSKL